MKKLLTFTFSALFLLMMSCTDPCKDKTCNDRGVCDDGTCLCDAGYEGTDCDTEARTKYYGTFSGVLVCPDEDDQEMTLLIRESSTGVTYLQVTTPDDPDNPDNIQEIELVGNVATAPTVEFEIFGIMVVIDQTITFTTVDQAEVIFTTTALGDTSVCNATLTRE